MQPFEEPQSEEVVAGRLRYQRPVTPYERFMEEEGIPLYRGIGLYDSRRLSLGPWRRLGGRGSFIVMGSGTPRGLGRFVVEIPPAGILNSERHIYEEVYFVVEGRGTTEVWREGSGHKQIFEWQAGSLFSIPLNTWHRLVNATSSPALLIGTTTAPPIMNRFHNLNFIFDNPFEFTDRYDESETYFRPREEVEANPMTGRAVRRSNFFPDVAFSELPLDNQKSPGYRRVEPQMAGNVINMFIGQHQSGRYAKAHAHGGFAGPGVLILRGRGYTFAWPRSLGIRPWEEGKGEQVVRQDYVAGGMFSPAASGGEWYHMHFPVGKDGLRILAMYGGDSGEVREEGSRGEELTHINADVRDGGTTIGYDIEDPFIRKVYLEELKKEGVEFRMPESVYYKRTEASGGQLL